MNKRELLEEYNRQRTEVIDKLLDEGVEFTDITGVTISPEAKFGKNVIIHRGTIIKGATVVGDGCEIGPDTILDECTVSDNTKILMCVCEKSNIGSGVTMGPYSHLRPNSTICDNVHIGNFCEVKNSVVGEGTKAGHLTYIGDTDCGKNVNFGCGVVVANYDGKNKHRTIIGDDCFIGSNTNLVAPVTLGNASLTAAGSTVTDEVPDKAMAIARARQVNKENWKERKKK